MITKTCAPEKGSNPFMIMEQDAAAVGWSKADPRRRR